MECYDGSSRKGYEITGTGTGRHLVTKRWGRIGHLSQSRMEMSYYADALAFFRVKMARSGYTDSSALAQPPSIKPLLPEAPEEPPVAPEPQPAPTPPTDEDCSISDRFSMLEFD